MSRFPLHNIRVLEGPEGPPLVLLHGFPLDGRMWEPQASPLSTVRKVLVPDLLGFGKSPPMEGAWSLADQADALEGTLSSMGVRRIVLCGLSMGGTLAVAFAARHPDRLAGLILMDGKAGAESEEGKAIRTRFVDQVKAEGTRNLVEGYAIKLLAPDTRAGRPELVETLKEIMAEQSPETVIRTLEAIRDRPDLEGSLGGISCPALLVVGEKDLFVSPLEMRAMALAIPQGRLVVIPGVGHMSNMEAPETFNRLAAVFLKEITE